MAGSFKPTIRIQSDGTGPSTVVTLDDGTPVDGVKSATIWLDHGSVNTVTLEILLPAHDVHAVVTGITFVCRCCGESVGHECKGPVPEMTLSGGLV